MELLLLGLHVFNVDPKEASSFRGEFTPWQSLGQDVRNVVGGNNLAYLDDPIDTGCPMKLINIKKCFDLLIREDRVLESCIVGLLFSMTTAGKEIGR